MLLKEEFLSRLLIHCLDIRAVWSLGRTGEPSGDGEARAMLVFADRATLERLRRCDELREVGVQVLVVTDGDRFESAWGGQHRSGSLARWQWREASAEEAYFDESRWDAQAEPRTVMRVRRRARRVWCRALQIA